jgi:hypothetical protein
VTDRSRRDDRELLVIALAAAMALFGGCRCGPPQIAIAGAIWDPDLDPTVLYTHELGCPFELPALSLYPNKGSSRAASTLARMMRGTAKLSIVITAEHGSEARVLASSLAARVELLEDIRERSASFHAAVLELEHQALDLAAIERARAEHGEIAVVVVELELDHLREQLVAYGQVRTVHPTDAASLADRCREHGPAVLDLALRAGLSFALERKAPGRSWGQVTYLRPEHP